MAEHVFPDYFDGVYQIPSPPPPPLIPTTNPDPNITKAIMVYFMTPSARCNEPYNSHSGVCHPCQGQNHGTQQHFVCEECADRTHKDFETNHPQLLKHAFLPLCPICTQIAWTDQPLPIAHSACICPIPSPTLNTQKWRVSTGHVKWLCAECRTEELESIQFKAGVEDEEIRRGIVGVEGVNRVPTIAIMGRLCCCLRHLGGNLSVPLPGCAWRCAGCYKYKHHGVPYAFIDQAGGPNAQNHGPNGQNQNHHARPSAQNNPNQTNMS